VLKERYLLHLYGRQMSQVKGRKFPPEVLTTQEILGLLDECGTSRTGTRNRALLVLMWRTGLRLDEALSLEPKDVSGNEVRVLHGKGDKSRTVGIDDGAVREVDRWLERRDELHVTRGTTLFCTLKGAKLKPSYVRDMMKRLAERAEIHKRVHPHGLRHTHAYELMMEGVPVNIIMRQLGHANIATTSRYLDHIAPVEVLRVIRERTW
jgi:site-specific recombinase XerD